MRTAQKPGRETELGFQQQLYDFHRRQFMFFVPSALNDQIQFFNLYSVLSSAGDRVEPGSIDVAMA